MDIEAMRRQARDKRKAMGWGQSDVAKWAGVSTGTVQNFELGKAIPQPENLAAILRVLDLDPNVVSTPSTHMDVVFPPPVSIETVARTWPVDVSVFLDMMGAYLVRFPEEQRLQLIGTITRQIFASREDTDSQGS